jgi:hypothetical protein
MIYSLQEKESKIVTTTTCSRIEVFMPSVNGKEAKK